MMQIPDRLKGTWWDHPLPMEELEAITPLSPERTRAFELTPFEMLELGLLFIGNDNSIVLPITNDQGPKRAVLEDNSGAIATDLAALEVLQTTTNSKLDFVKNAVMINSNTQQVSGGNETELFRAQKKISFAEITLAGGSLANVPLVIGLGGFTAFIQPIAIWSDTADHYTFAFESETDVDAEPALANIIAVETKANNEIGPFATTHGVAGDNSGSPPLLPHWHGPAQDAALECDVSGGAGAEEIVLWYREWYEDLT